MFNYSGVVDIDSFLQYFISMDLGKFWQISLDAVPEVGSLWFCALVGIRLGVAFIRQAINSF